jgi:hypothetical protein
MLPPLLTLYLGSQMFGRQSLLFHLFQRFDKPIPPICSSSTCLARFLFNLPGNFLVLIKLLQQLLLAVGGTRSHLLRTSSTVLKIFKQLPATPQFCCSKCSPLQLRLLRLLRHLLGPYDILPDTLLCFCDSVDAASKQLKTVLLFGLYPGQPFAVHHGRC